jgi:hypothetical protein
MKNFFCTLAPDGNTPEEAEGRHSTAMDRCIAFNIISKLSPTFNDSFLSRPWKFFLKTLDGIRRAAQFSPIWGVCMKIAPWRPL